MESRHRLKYGTPQAITRLSGSTSSTTDLERYQRSVYADISAAATFTIYLPSPGETEGDIFEFKATGTTGNVKIWSGVTSWALTTNADLTLRSDGLEYRSLQ